MKMLRLSTVLLSAALVLGCKAKEKEPAPVPTATTYDAATGAMTPVADAAAAGDPATAGDPSFPLSPGETYFGGKVVATNLLEWKVSDGTVIKLGIVTTGKGDQEGHEKGVLRAYYDGKGHDLQTYSIHTTAEHWADLKTLPNDRALFRYGQQGDGHRNRNAVVLRWDPGTKQVVVAKRWAGPGKAEEPAWLATGEYKAPTESQDLCAKIVARMVSCEKDPKFREALFRNLDAANRPGVEKDFEGNIARWKKPAEAKAQCQKWASDEYVETHFSEVAALQVMADETKLDCEFFGREIDDGGGLPRPIAAAPTK